MKKRCMQCGWGYPMSLLNVMYTGSGNLEDICAECYREISEKMHGAPIKKLTGKLAELMRQDALKWRKDHPEDAPHVQ